ncbi:MAG: 1-acyl-sn-glycerol-3-phosphate acyltransferase [Acidimicrobiia bacterium]|nr:1-acyl-sn-glycerol-3-phosphate acyltransferase [Acidimicrobiia bacterium]
MSEGTATGDTGRRDELHIPAGHRRGEQMSLAQRAFYRFMWYVVQVIARGYFRLQINGAEHVPRAGAFIVAPAHRSNLDTPVMAAITRRRLRYMGKESLWKKPAGGWFLTSLGGFPVRRGTADREAIRACLEVLANGEPLVVFPEGTRQSGPDLTELKDGTAYLACKAQVPIVPVGIGGSEAAMGKGMTIPRPQRLVLVIGEAIQPPTVADGGRVPRSALRRLTAELGERIQELFDEAQARAGTPRPPRA